MRNIKELLYVMLEHQEHFGMGLCRWSLNLLRYKIITFEEFVILSDHRYENSTCQIYNVYWWTAGELQPRLNWINEQINKLP